LNLEEDNVGVVLLGPSVGIKKVLLLKNTTYLQWRANGRTCSYTLGFPIDGKGPIGGDLYQMPLERKAPGVISSTSNGAITNRD
jgi:F-type H+-transporting ATPase subunit alpha